MRKKAGRPRNRIFLPVLILVFSVSSFISWSVAHSQETLTIAWEKGGHPKIESALFDLQQEYLLHGTAGGQALAQQRNLRIHDQDRVTVYILPKAGESKDTIDIESLRAYGGEVIKSGHSVIKARVPILLLDQIADHVGGINYIKHPDRPQIEVVSEGVNLTGASSYQASGNAGQNIKVAIVDLGFANLSDAIAGGVLPSSVIKIDCTGTDCAPTEFPLEEEDHGTAVAEIVHDMAPAAQLYLIKIGDSLDLLNAKDYCIANGVRVINHSVGWFNSNFYDGGCYFDNAVCTANKAFKDGILWANSAGNHARRHYGATFSDPDGDSLHNVTGDSNYISLYAYEGDPIIALMTWEAWPATDQDYDLLLYNSSMALVSSSANVQNGRQPPAEEVDYVAPASGTYYLAVRNANARSNLRFSIFTFYQDLNPYVSSGSLLSPADATGVMAVAAVNYAKWLTGPQESFSSRGPTMDGRMKPEISGPDGVSSFIYGSFLGSSASSPHLAGAAALILSNNTDFTVSQVWNAITSSAIDLGASGQDPIFGYGRLNLSTISVDPASIDFGDVILGQGVEKTVTIRNVGNPTLVFGVIDAPPAPYAIVSDSCSEASLPLAGACALRVRFSPSSTGSFNAALTVPSNDPFNKALTVSLKGEGVLIINLLSPTDQLPVDPCSNIIRPVFDWEVFVSFASYELQFSPDPDFGSVPLRIRVSKTSSYAMTPAQWKKVLAIPGPEGGSIYWRVVGKASGSVWNASSNRSILIPGPHPAGTPSISAVSRSQLPTLSWQNQCNVKFKVWFGNDAGFSRKTSLSYHTSDPLSNGGAFSKGLTLSQWLGIRRLVGDQPGAKVFWYVESWDSLNRHTVTETMSFVLMD